MKKLLLSISILMLVSCSSPLSKKFDTKTYGADIAEIGEKISKEDKDLLNKWVLSHSIVGKEMEINGLTYEQLLDNAKKDQQEKKIAKENFLKAKYTDLDKFFTELQKLVDNHVIDMDEEEAGCIGSFIGYKQKESKAIFNMTHQQILDAAPGFCEEERKKEDQLNFDL